MSEVNLGALVTDELAERDAVHVAIWPATAGEDLRAGDRVGFIGYEAKMGKDAPALIGVVDPFLPSPVLKDQRFWLCLFPNTITSLRHDWSHPAFEKETAQRLVKEESEGWLKDWLSHHDCPEDYEWVMRVIASKPYTKVYPNDNGSQDDECYGERDGTSLFFRGVDAHADIPPEFWRHVEVVMGVKLNWCAVSFSCSC